jgi:hypothetical protein
LEEKERFGILLWVFEFGDEAEEGNVTGWRWSVWTIRGCKCFSGLGHAQKEKTMLHTPKKAWYRFVSTAASSSPFQGFWIPTAIMTIITAEKTLRNATETS